MKPEEMIALLDEVIDLLDAGEKGLLLAATERGEVQFKVFLKYLKEHHGEPAVVAKATSLLETLE